MDVGIMLIKDILYHLDIGDTLNLWLVARNIDTLLLTELMISHIVISFPFPFFDEFSIFSTKQFLSFHIFISWLV